MYDPMRKYGNGEGVCGEKKCEMEREYANGEEIYGFRRIYREK